MIYLTYTYNRDVFNRELFQNWIKKLFGQDVRFDGYKYGRRYPTIRIPLHLFEANKDSIPTNNLVKIRGEFDFLETLIYGVRDFENELKPE